MKINSDIDKYSNILSKLKIQQEEIWAVELDEETTLNEHKLDDISLSRSALYNKWLARALKVSKVVAIVELELDRTISDLHDHYLLESDVSYKDAEIKMKIKAHDNYIKLKTILIECKTLSTYLEKSLKNIDDIRWDVKNYIEWKKLIML